MDAVQLLLATAEKLSEEEDAAIKAEAHEIEEAPMEYAFLAGIGLRKGLRGKQRRKEVLLERQLAHLREAAGIMDEEHMVAEALFDLANMTHEPSSNGFHLPRHDTDRPSYYNNSRHNHQRSGRGGQRRNQLTPQRRHLDEDDECDEDEAGDEDYGDDEDAPAGNYHQNHYHHQQQHQHHRRQHQQPYSQGDDWADDDADGEEGHTERGYRQQRGGRGGRGGPPGDTKRQRGWHGGPVHGSSARVAHADTGMHAVGGRRGGKRGHQHSSSPEYDVGDTAGPRRVVGTSANGLVRGAHARPPAPRRQVVTESPGVRGAPGWGPPQPHQLTPSRPTASNHHPEQQQQQQPHAKENNNNANGGPAAAVPFHATPANMHALAGMGMPPQMLQMLQHMGKICMATLPNGMTVPVAMGPEGQIIPLTGWPGMNPFLTPPLAAKMMSEGGMPALGHMAHMSQHQPGVGAAQGPPAKGTAFASAGPSQAAQRPVQGQHMSASQPQQIPRPQQPQQQQQAGARPATGYPAGMPLIPQQQQPPGQPVPGIPAAGIPATGIPARGWPQGGTHVVGGMATPGAAVLGAALGSKHKSCLLHVQIAHWIQQRQKQAQRAGEGAGAEDGREGAKAELPGMVAKPEQRAVTERSSSEGGGDRNGEGGLQVVKREVEAARDSDGEQSTSAINDAGQQQLQPTEVARTSNDGPQWHGHGGEDEHQAHQLPGNGLNSIATDSAGLLQPTNAPVNRLMALKQEADEPAGPEELPLPIQAAAGGSPSPLPVVAAGLVQHAAQAQLKEEQANGYQGPVGAGVVAAPLAVTGAVGPAAAPRPAQPQRPAVGVAAQPRPAAAMPPAAGAPAQGLPYGMPPQAAILCALMLQAQNAAAMAGKGMHGGSVNAAAAQGIPMLTSAALAGASGLQQQQQQPPQHQQQQQREQMPQAAGGMLRGVHGAGQVHGLAPGTVASGLPPHLAMLAGAQASFPFLSGLQMSGLPAMQQQQLGQGQGFPVAQGAPAQVKQAGVGVAGGGPGPTPGVDRGHARPPLAHHQPPHHQPHPPA